MRLGESYDRSRAGVWRGFTTWEALKSVSVGLLLCAVVASAITGAEAAFFITLLFAWLLFPLLVGIRNTLDAGCAFMLVSVGVVVVVGLAQNGLGYLFP